MSPVWSVCPEQQHRTSGGGKESSHRASRKLPAVTGGTGASEPRAARSGWVPASEQLIPRRRGALSHVLGGEEEDVAMCHTSDMQWVVFNIVCILQRFVFTRRGGGGGGTDSLSLGTNCETTAPPPTLCFF